MAVAPIDAEAVRIGGEERSDASEVSVGVPTDEFSARSRDGRVRPANGATDEVVAALKGVPNSTRWKKLTVEGGPQGIIVARRGGAHSDWICDLWLAERLRRAHSKPRDADCPVVSVRQPEATSPNTTQTPGVLPKVSKS